MTVDNAKIKLRGYFEEACEVLGVNHRSIPFVYDHIGDRFRTVGNTCETDGNRLFINEDWLIMCLNTNYLYDLQYQMYHEARHFYQSMVIADFHARGKSSELPSTILQWENECLHYLRNEGTADVDSATITATISYNGIVIKTLTKEIFHIEDIDGETVLCDQENYSINDLPNNFSVTWSINNSNFTISPSDTQCFVSYIGTPQCDVANLTATITRQGQTIGSLTKRIVMHGTDLLVDGWQNGSFSPNGTYPDVEFTIPNNRTSPSRARSERLLEEDLADKESLPIDFTRDLTNIHPDISPVDLCGYGFTEIYGGNMVYLNSDRFDGMNLSFSGSVSPTYLYRSENNGNVIFNLPYQNSVYYTTLHAQSDDHCHDFCLSFKVMPLPGAASGDDEISVELSGYMLNITFMGSMGTPIGNGQINMPSYSVTISKVPEGTLMYSHTFPGYENYFSVNTSSWTSGIYSIKIVQSGNVYRKTIIL